MNRSAEQIYQQIGRTLNETAPQGWKVAWVVATVGADSGQTAYRYVDASGEQKWFEPTPDRQYEVFLAFQELLEQMLIAGQRGWTAAKLEISKVDGRFNLSFAYSEDSPSAP